MAKRLWHRHTGEAQNFADHIDAGDDWITHHPHDTARMAAKKPPKPRETDLREHDDERKGEERKGEEPPLTRAEIMAALREGGITYDARTTTVTLTETLDKALREVLAARGATASPAATTRELLAAVRG
jgi:ABC-type nitrate/sulfonate/bicarbonate transport system substrate-binding protein